MPQGCEKHAKIFSIQSLSSLTQKKIIYIDTYTCTHVSPWAHATSVYCFSVICRWLGSFCVIDFFFSNIQIKTITIRIQMFDEIIVHIAHAYFQQCAYKCIFILRYDFMCWKVIVEHHWVSTRENRNENIISQCIYMLLRYDEMPIYMIIWNIISRIIRIKHKCMNVYINDYWKCA